MEMQSRDEERCLELDGVVWGLEMALDLVEIAKDEQGQPAPHPLPRVHSDEKLLINGGDDMSEEMEDDQEEEPSREAQSPEGPQAQGKPTVKEL